MHMKHIYLSLLLAVASGQAIADQAFSTIEERMTGKEFMETGMGKLSPQELAALNDWLRAHSVATLDEARALPAAGAGAAAATAGGVDTRGFESQVSSEFDKQDIVANIKGPFNGWRDGTTFVLDNGMIWEQAESSTFSMPATENARVIIEAGVFGSWRLRADGYNRSVKVKRIQ
jgi:hypothetical protein